VILQAHGLADGYATENIDSPWVLDVNNDAGEEKVNATDCLLGC
jgi:hypothetical protein